MHARTLHAYPLITVTTARFLDSTVVIRACRDMLSTEVVTLVKIPCARKTCARSVGYRASTAVIFAEKDTTMTK